MVRLGNQNKIWKICILTVVMLIVILIISPVKKVTKIGAINFKFKATVDSDEQLGGLWDYNIENGEVTILGIN